MKKTNLSITTLKSSFNKIAVSNRFVGVWNLKRRVMMRTYPQHLISELDASGYIKKWLNNEK